MKIQGKRTFALPRPVVWRALLDPDVLARTLPGCDRLETVGQHEFKGGLNVRVGPVQGRFSGTVKLTDVTPESGFRIRIDGQGSHGFTRAEGSVLLDGDDAETTLRYDLDAQVGGRIASVGQRLLESSARAIVQQALDGLGSQLELLRGASTPGGGAPGAAAPTQAEFAAGVARKVAGEHRTLLFAAGLVALVVLALVALLILRD